MIYWNFLCYVTTVDIGIENNFGIEIYKNNYELNNLLFFDEIVYSRNF